MRPRYTAWFSTVFVVAVWWPMNKANADAPPPTPTPAPSQGIIASPPAIRHAAAVVSHPREGQSS